MPESWQSFDRRDRVAITPITIIDINITGAVNMRKKKLNATFTTLLDHDLSDVFLKQISKYVPYETTSSVMRMAIALVTAIGLDVLCDKGVFWNNSSQAIMKIAKTIRGENNG